MAYRAGRYFEELCVQQDSEDEIAQSVFFFAVHDMDFHG